VAAMINRDAPGRRLRGKGAGSMSCINISFCRALLSAVHRDVKAFAPEINLQKDAWVWCAGRDHWEFHGPKNDFYWHGGADNAYDARAKGWSAWLRF
jgi:hypothetical protein